MVKANSIALSAALFGANIIGANAQNACFALFNTGTTYAAGDMVSATVTVTSTAANGMVTTMTQRHNFECVSGPNSAFCNQAGFMPGGQFSSTAWIMEAAQCDTTATPATIPPPPAWSGVGCPAPFSAAADYSEGDVVSVVMGTYTAVYQCMNAPVDQFCSLPGYEPGTSQFFENAWTNLGSCSGTISPTSSPSFDVLMDVGGCPSMFSAGETYEEGDRVTVDGFVYECMAFPNSLRCSQIGYEPGTSIGSGAQIVEYWREAWSIIGVCSGTIAPTTSPNFVALAMLGGCPDEWMPITYEEGDRVSAGQIVYQCRAFPFSGFCGQMGYEPNVDTATPGAWRDAWDVVGYCSGSIGPTSSPTFDVMNSVGACPDEFVRLTTYEEGDMVSLAVSTMPLRQIAYRCRPWPFSGFCGQLSPTEFGGDQGWELVGSCDGSIGPTASPSFDTLAATGMGCPAEWNPSTIDYEAGDQVSYTVSMNPARRIVFQCREWPNTGYCNQGAGFEPTTQFANLAWTQLGFCDGTIAPTAAPAAYAGTCTFNRCVTMDVNVNCVPGSTGCSCTAGQPQTAACVRVEQQQVCTVTDVDPWMPNVDYITDDVVRVGLSRFRCREWPNFFWCRIEAYMPSLTDNSIWPQAWREDGTCPPP